MVVQEKLLQSAKAALADLEGIMPVHDPDGDRTHPGWQTINDLKVAIAHSEKNGWRQLWEELGDIPINEEEETEEIFLHFPIGTGKYDIWHWFEDEFNLTLGKVIVDKLKLKFNES